MTDTLWCCIFVFLSFSYLVTFSVYSPFYFFTSLPTPPSLSSGYLVAYSQSFLLYGKSYISFLFYYLFIIVAILMKGLYCSNAVVFTVPD